MLEHVSKKEIKNELAKQEKDVKVTQTFRRYIS